ncbi:MAG: ketoacyl-ACP synthase III [Deltaproteobacteria bacterium]|nr:ketoacyl-ACP synthase III [Deltaproteobacteria bacterium]MBW2359704.1 ketoacyl-ACP synthase III [Deltaproteobacteria bacterium]
MARRAKITGTGMYVPERVVTNEDLAKLMDTSDEWIRQRSGIAERRHIEPGQTPSDLALAASRRALDAAGLDASDIDCIVLATLSPEADFPGTSFFLQDKLEAGDTPCFDLRAQCSGFGYALSVAKSFIEAGQFRRILLLGCEVHSTGLDFTDAGRDVAVLFGDGAGAVVLEANEDASDTSALLEIRLHAQGKFAKKLWVEAPGSGIAPARMTHELIDQGRHFPHMQGKFVFKNAVTRMPEVLIEALNATSLKLDDVDLFLFHQANLRINDYVAQQLEIPPEKCLNNIQRYGNCSAASIPILLDEAVREGQLERGQVVAMTTFGSGFSWSCAVARY